MKKKIIMICAAVLALVLALFALTACNSANTDEGVNLLAKTNGDFNTLETLDSKKGTWKFANWFTNSSSTKFDKGTVSDEASDYHLTLINENSSYSYLKQTVAVDRNCVYEVKVDIRIDANIRGKDGAYVAFLENTGYKFLAHSNVTSGFVTSTCYVKPKNTDYLTVALCLGSEEEGATGRVMFDNLSITRVDPNSVPDGYDVIEFKKAKAVATSSTASGIAFVVVLTVLGVVLLVAVYLLVRRLYSRKDVFVNFDGAVKPYAGSKKKGKNAPVKVASKWYLNPFFIAACLALGAFIIRLILLLTTTGFGSDTGTLVNLARKIAPNGETTVMGFFEKQPTSTMAPGALYILSLLGGMGVKLSDASLSILIRFVNVLADMAIVVMIYFYGRKYVGDKLSTVYAALYAVLPFAFLMSGINSSFECLLLALLMGAVILMVEKKYLATYAVMTLATVLDMRAMAIAPIVVAYFAYRYYKDDSSLKKFTANRLMIILGLVGSFVLGYILTLPIGIHQIQAGDAFFNFKMLVQQISGNTRFVNNAFNIYGMVGMNGKTIAQNGINILNLIFLLVLEAYVISLYFKNRNKHELILLISFTFAIISVFTLKVDYTYLLLAIAFGIVYTMISGDKRMYGIIAGYSALGFLDAAQLLNQSKLIASNTLNVNIVNYESLSPFYIFFCVITVLLSCYYVYVTYSITNNSKIVDIKAMPSPVIVTFKNAMKNLASKFKKKQESGANE